MFGEVFLFLIIFLFLGEVKDFFLSPRPPYPEDWMDIGVVILSAILIILIGEVYNGFQ